MKRARFYALERIAVGFAAVALLAACASNASSDTPGASAGLQGQSQAFNRAGVQNDAGEYSGTVNDTTFGSGSATASLAQDEHTVGGVLTTTFGTNSFPNSVALETPDGVSLAGAQVGNENGTCSYGLNATYNPNSHVLKGTYKAVHGCSGEKGTFSLTKECFYPRKGLLDAVVWSSNSGFKPDNGLHQC